MLRAVPSPKRAAGPGAAVPAPVRPRPNRLMRRVHAARDNAEPPPAAGPAVDLPTRDTDANSSSSTASAKSQPSPASRKDAPAQPSVQNTDTHTHRYSLPDPTLAVRNLIESAQHAHLCSNMASMHHRRAGYPFGMLVDFAVDGAGYPLFCLSPLSIHCHNLREDARCSLVVQMPGWHARSNACVTIFGDVYELPDESQDMARDIFFGKQHGGGKMRIISHSFRFYRMMHICDIYFVGGFGTIQWIDPAAFSCTQPDAIVLYHRHETIDLITARYGRDLAKMFVSEGLGDAADAAVISIDAKGMDVRVGQAFGADSVQRLAFHRIVTCPKDALAAVGELLEGGAALPKASQ